MPQRLARVSETNEESSDRDVEDMPITVNVTPCISPSSSSPSLKVPRKNSTRRSSNQLHVTIKEDMDCDGNTSQHSDSSSRRPSVLVQEILSSRRPSAIMAALRSPKQFVNRYRREYVCTLLDFFLDLVFSSR